MPVHYRPKGNQHIVAIDFSCPSGTITKKDADTAIHIVKSFCYEYPKGDKHGKAKGRKNA